MAFTLPLTCVLHIRYFKGSPECTDDLMRGAGIAVDPSAVFTMHAQDTDTQAPPPPPQPHQLWDTRRSQLLALLDRIYAEVSARITHLVVLGTPSNILAVLLGRELHRREPFALVTYIDTGKPGSAPDTFFHLPPPTPLSPPDSPRLFDVTFGPRASQGLHLFVDVFGTSSIVPCTKCKYQTASLTLSRQNPITVTTGTFEFICHKLYEALVTMHRHTLITPPILVATTGPAPLAIFLGVALQQIFPEFDLEGQIIQYTKAAEDMPRRENTVVKL